MRLVIRLTSLGSEGCLLEMRTAVDSTTVAIALRPAARMVSPDSESIVSVYCDYSGSAEAHLTNEIDNAVCNTKSASGFYTASDVLDRCLELLLAVDLCACDLLLHLTEVLL